MRNTTYGGNLSAQSSLNMNPVFIVGQDKAIFNQCICSKNNWFALDLSTSAVSYGEGYSILINSFVSR